MMENGLFDLNVILLVSLAYGINRFWLKNAISLPVISYVLKCHFNDWLAGIVLIAYINLLLSFSRYRHIKLDNGVTVVWVCFFCGLLWEYIFPFFWSHGTSDIWDIVSYAIGGKVYIMLLNRYRSK